MPKTHRDIVIEETMATVEEAMAEVLNYWGCLPEPMKEAIEQFRTQLGAAIDSVDLVKRALEREAHEGDPGDGPP
jgi:BMFP domain-containing protein YqiC